MPVTRDVLQCFSNLHFLSWGELNRKCVRDVTQKSSSQSEVGSCRYWDRKNVSKPFSMLRDREPSHGLISYSDQQCLSRSRNATNLEEKLALAKCWLSQFSPPQSKRLSSQNNPVSGWLRAKTLCGWRYNVMSAFWSSLTNLYRTSGGAAHQ